QRSRDDRAVRERDSGDLRRERGAEPEAVEFLGRRDGPGVGSARDREKRANRDPDRLAGAEARGEHTPSLLASRSEIETNARRSRPGPAPGCAASTPAAK